MEGKFSVGGAKGFMRLMDKRSVPRESYITWEGYIPACFAQFPADTRFSLVLVDVDHYQPTVDALQWSWPRLNRGGYLLLDDCGFDWDLESSRAIKEFLSSTNGFWVMGHYNNQLILRKDADRD